MPVFASRGFNHDVAISFFDNASAGPGNARHRTLEVAGEQHVGTAPNQQRVLRKTLGIVEVLHQVHLRLKVVEPFRLDVQAKGVVGLQ